jgi:glycosyltransferase involved in cell wall biosynthesis
MQAKVSMVIPCYNKVSHIGEMLQSVHDQLWNNIELILVNDGSTDGTREVIAAWEPKLRARGYEVVIVDQENRGVAAAVKTGLMRLTGAYVCQVDADDALEPEYVSAMTDCLEANAEYDWCACDFLMVFEEKDAYVLEMPEEHLGKHMLENFMFFRIDTSAWKYMIRRNYLERCDITERFETTQRVSQEPQIVIPLIVGGGRLKHIGRALYRRRIHPDNSSASLDTFGKWAHFWDMYYDITIKTLEKQDIDAIQKRRLIVLAKIARLQQLLISTDMYEERSEIKTAWAEEAKDLIRKHFVLDLDFNAEYVVLEHILFFRAFVEWMFGKAQTQKIIYAAGTKGRVIAWGVLGKWGRRFMPLLLRSEFAPTELWDASAETGAHIGDMAVSKPDCEKLSTHDTVLILPERRTAVREIRDRLAGTGSQQYAFDDIIEHFTACKFPQFKGKCIFVP